MKIRNGFVSNSSTSSFCIYGTHLEYEDDLIKALIEKGFATKEELLDGVSEYAWNKNNKFFTGDIGFECPYDGDDGVYIGIEWNKIKDDETGAQFKARIEEKMKDLLGNDVECGTYSEAWRDG